VAVEVEAEMMTISEGATEAEGVVVSEVEEV